ncbi:Tyrosine-protein kinase receptor cam-1 [Geodia barretti]|uniref:Tyrosine-protein kinase receptor cam-1 n=1 Tax=Geodia barretti TaxID=519541 RepID=A0AA35RND8_GEOBA|nr:Tyrosine-protein kinase receptor cam-1 [Geodia barretti]
MMVGELEGAGRYCRNPGGLGEHPWCFVSDPNTGQRWGYCDVPVCEQCVPYAGEFCQPVGYSNSTSVLLRRQLKDSVADMELELRGTLHAVQEELTPGCEMLARQLLCSGALPTCENGNKLEVCEKQCHLLDMLLVCSQDLQKALRSISYIDFSVCHKNRSSLLPVSHPSCLPTPVLPDSKGTLNEDCYNVSTLGQTYTGDMNITQNGKSCLPWRTAPAARGLVATYLELNGSFCRNPGQLGRMPWCFTSTSGDWEYCDVTLCSAPTTSAITSQLTRDQSGVIVGSILATVLVTVALVVLSGILFGRWWKLSQQKRESVGPRQNIVGYSNGYTNDDRETGLSPALLEITQSFRKIEKQDPIPAGDRPGSIWDSVPGRM